MCGPRLDPGRGGLTATPAFAALLEDSRRGPVRERAVRLPVHLPDGTIAKINATLLGWLGRDRDDVVGRRRFSDLLTVGGRLYHETHFAPLLRMQGEVRGVALDLRTAAGERLPVLVTSAVKTGADGQPAADPHHRLRRPRPPRLRARAAARPPGGRHANANGCRLAGRRRCSAACCPPTLPAVPGHARPPPTTTPPPPDEVGGDFYDLFPLADGPLGASSSATCAARAPRRPPSPRWPATRCAPPPSTTPTRSPCWPTSTRVLTRSTPTRRPRYCTVLFGVLTPTRDRLPRRPGRRRPPPGAAAARRRLRRLQPTAGGMLIGVAPRRPDRHRAPSRSAPGDTLLLYTDGLTEARTSNGRFGPQSLRSFAGDHAAGGAAGVVDALTGLLGTLEPGIDDDTALLALQVMPAVVEEP